MALLSNAMVCVCSARNHLHTVRQDSSSGLGNPTCVLETIWSPSDPQVDGKWQNKLLLLRGGTPCC